MRVAALMPAVMVPSNAPWAAIHVEVLGRVGRARHIFLIS